MSDAFARSGARWPGVRACGAVLMVSAILLLLASVAYADELDDATRQIAKGLQCPICESTSVADSPSELAGQMRAVIRQKLERGDTEQQILAYFVERYGDGVLTEPPRRGFSALVWLAPALLLAAGAVVLGLVVRGWVRRSGVGQTGGSRARGQGGSADEDPYLERARAEFERSGSET